MEVDPPHPEDFVTLAKTNGLTVSITEPFNEQMGPKEFDGGPNFGKAAFTLTPTNDPFAGPLIGDNAVYVIAYNKQIPSEVPPFETLRERIATDFKRVQAAMMARQAGADFAQRATNEMAQGKSFATICAEAKVKPVVIPPFSLSSTNRPAVVEEHISLDQYKQIAFTTPPGKVSGFTPTPEGGVVVYVERKLPVDQAKMQAELPVFLKRVRQQREQEAFGEWFRKEAEKSLRDTPLLKRQATPGQPQPR
jgi:parvulin-like peptidyl-prolyl isomerase